MSSHFAKRYAGKSPTQRQLRINESIREILSGALHQSGLRDLGDVSVTITDVRVSVDMRAAIIYVMPLGGQNKKEVLDVLKTMAPQLRTELAKKMRTRYTPKLKFEADLSFDSASIIQDILYSPKVKKDIQGDEH